MELSDVSGKNKVDDFKFNERGEPQKDELKENLSSYENVYSRNLLQVQDSTSLSSSQRQNSGPPSISENDDFLFSKQQKFKDQSSNHHRRKDFRSKSLSVSNNIGDLRSSADSFRKSSLRNSSKQKTNDEESQAKTYVSIEENLNSLDKTIKQCYLQLNKKLRREAASNYVPGTSIVRVKSSLKTEKVIVFIRVVFLKIGEIDTMKENFAADAFIQARWRETALDGMVNQNAEFIDWNRFWNPKIYIENSYTEPKETIWQTVSFNSRQEATVFERRRIRGCFIENLELDEFPFDTQDLTLTITTERSDEELELEEDTDEISSINVQSFVDEQEWKLHSHVETWKKITTKAYQNSKAKHPSFSTSCRATRRPGFFVWNIFLVMLFICSLTFSTFCVDLMKPENRLQLSFILLLTTITFKFVVSQTLPRISYLTYLDKYILISMAILCAVCVWHAIVFSFFRDDLDLAKVVDRWALIISGSSYFLFHVFFFSTIYLVALKKRWLYDKKDKEHKERIKRLQRLQELAKMNIFDGESSKPDDIF